MKNKIYLLLLLISTQGYGQEIVSKEKRGQRHFYINVGTGYAVPSGSNVFSGTRYSRLYPNNRLDRGFNEKPGSYFAGMSGLLSVGVMVNKHIALEVGSNIGVYNKPIQSAYSAIDTNGVTYSSYSMTRKSKTPVLPQSSVVFHTGGKVIDMYTKIGVVAPLRTRQLLEIASIDNGQMAYESYSYSNKFTLGVSGALGMSYRMSNKVQLWAEASMLSLDPYLKKRELTASSLNGVNNLSTIPSEERTNTYAFSGSNVYTPYPKQASKVTYSNVGVKAGITLRLGDNSFLNDLTTKEKVQRLYFKVGVGYGFATSTGNGDNASNLSQNYHNPNYSTQSFSVKPSSYSAGLNGNIGVGYFINKHVGVELGATLGLANKKSIYNYVNLNSKSTITYNGETSIVYSDFYMTKTTYSEMPVVLLPSLILQTGNEKMNIYSRLGIALPVKANVIEEMTYDDIPNASVHNTIFNTEYSTRFTIGYNMALGASLRLGKHIKLWTEANMLLLAPYLKEAKQTRQINVGGGKMEYLPEMDIATKYEFSGSHIMENAITQQNEFITNTVPFSTGGLQVGISFYPAALLQ